MIDFSYVPDEEKVILSRSYNAPRDLVFKVWTECEHMSKWWGPKSWNLSHCRIDLWPGGIFLYCMRSPDGDGHWGRLVFHEIIEPERLVFTNTFSDEHGGFTRALFNPDWPREMLCVLTFMEDNGKTVVKFEATPSHATELERQTFIEGKDSFEQGWGGCLEELEEYLPTVQ